MSQKVQSLLASLRGEPLPEPAASAPGPASEELDALKQKIEELERRLQELVAPVPGAEEVAPQPPAPPTELALFLQTRVDLLERKLELAQQEALRANLLLREREETQRKAQKEVEDLFRPIREQQRAANFDRALRERYSAARTRIQELEASLALAELKMVPAEMVLRHLEAEEGRAWLEGRLRSQLQEFEKRASETPVMQPPAPAREGDSGEEQAGPGPGPAREETPALSVALARMVDLERRLEEAQAEREKERQARLRWESDILAALRQTRSQWQKAGGPEMLVEASLETIVDSLRQRDAAFEELQRLVSTLRDEPPDSREAASLRVRIEERRRDIDDIQAKLDRQLAVVQAWLQRGKGV